MPYVLYISPRAQKSFRKFPKNIRKQLIKEILILEEKPDIGTPLKGKFRLFRALHIKLINVQYRVVYRIDPINKDIEIKGLGTRENFYSQLETMKIKPLKEK